MGASPCHLVGLPVHVLRQRDAEHAMERVPWIAVDPMMHGAPDDHSPSLGPRRPARLVAGQSMRQQSPPAVQSMRLVSSTVNQPVIHQVQPGSMIKIELETPMPSESSW